MTPLYSRAALAEVYLPIQQMLQIDRVTEVTAQDIRYELDLSEHWVFPLHFPRNPIFPACLMIEAAGQAIAIWVRHHQVPGNPRLARVRLLSRVRPSPAMACFLSWVDCGSAGISAWGRLNFFCGNRRVASVEETLAFVA